MGPHQRVEEDYEHDVYDEYEEETYASEDEYEEEVPVPNKAPTKEQQEFLNLREQLKDKIRKKMKKQIASDFGHSSQLLDTKKTMKNDKFGSFFGRAEQVIAPRVLEERRSIRENQHTVTKDPSSSSINKRAVSTSSEPKTYAVKPQIHAHQQQKYVNEDKNKAQKLKDMRDYSFLLSDDADFPSPVKEQPAPRKLSNSGNAHRPVPLKDRPIPQKVPFKNLVKEQSAPRKVPNSGNADRSASVKPIPRKVPLPDSGQSQLKNRNPICKPQRLVSSGHEKSNSAPSSEHKQSKMGSMKANTIRKPNPVSVDSRKAISVGSTNGPGRPVVHKAPPPKIPAHATSASKPPPKVTNVSSMQKKPLPAKPHASVKNNLAQQKRVTQELSTTKVEPKRPLASSKVQMPPKSSHDGRPKKRPARTDYDDDGSDAIQMIRSMFRYNPNKYAGVDDQDDSDMEVGFDTILAEERKSSKIAKEEDEEQLRLIEEEERRERMRKKKKLRRG